MPFKYSLLLAFFLFAFCNSQAQDSRFNAGLLLGANASQIQGDDEAGYNKLGALTGLSAQILFSPKTELVLEIAFSQLGSRSTRNDIFPFKSTFNYIAVPVYFKYKDWIDEEAQYYKLHFFGGFSYARLVSTKMEGSPFSQIKNYVRDNYAGILLGAAYYINSHIGIGSRWERSILDIYNNHLNNGGPPVQRPIWSKHLSFYVTYSFL